MFRIWQREQSICHQCQALFSFLVMPKMFVFSWWNVNMKGWFKNMEALSLSSIAHWWKLQTNFFQFHLRSNKHFNLAFFFVFWYNTSSLFSMLCLLCLDVRIFCFQLHFNLWTSFLFSMHFNVWFLLVYLVILVHNAFVIWSPNLTIFGA